MRNFDGHDGKPDTPWSRGGEQPVILEGELVGDSVHVAPPEPESIWGANAARLGKRLLIAAVVLALLAVLLPLTIAIVAVIAILALVGRLVLGRPGAVVRWPRPPGRGGF